MSKTKMLNSRVSTNQGGYITVITYLSILLYISTVYLLSINRLGTQATACSCVFIC